MSSLEESGNDGSGVIIMKTLANNARATQTNLIFVHSSSSQFLNNGSQKITEGTNDLFDKAVKGRCWLIHLLGHQLSEPRGFAFTEHPEKKQPDKILEPIFRRDILTQPKRERVLLH